MTDSLQFDKFWVDKTTYSDAEKQYYEGLAKLPNSKGLLPFSNTAEGSTPNPEELQSPKSFVAIKKISISECETNKENISVSSPETPKSNIRKIKSQKCVLSKDESEWITVCSKSELKEKNSKKNKKAKDRAVEVAPSPVVINEPSPPASPKEEVVTVVQQTPPAETASKSPKNKEGKEKMSKAEKKRSNKKEKAEVKEEKAQIIEKVEEVVLAVEKIVDIQGESATPIVSGQCSLSREIAKARQHIKNSLECMDTVMASVPSVEISNRLNTLETGMNDLRKLVLKIQEDVSTLMKHIPAGGKPAASASSAKPQAKPVAPAPSKEDSDDGVDLFASDSEDDEAAAKVREERLAEYAAKKSKKPTLIAKSSIILDVKPWDDETDMNEMERQVRTIKTDGLLWGASKFVLLAYGIKKLQITCVVEDEKVSIDWLQEEIEKQEDLVQSVDIAAFNKI